MACTSLNIGCFGHCDDLALPLLAKQTGLHYLIFDWLGTRHKIESYNVTGTLFKFRNEMNESSRTTFRIEQPDGTYYSDDNGNDCFNVSTVITFEQESVCIDDFFNKSDNCTVRTI